MKHVLKKFNEQSGLTRRCTEGAPAPAASALWHPRCHVTDTSHPSHIRVLPMSFMPATAHVPRHVHVIHASYRVCVTSYPRHSCQLPRKCHVISRTIKQNFHWTNAYQWRETARRNGFVTGQADESISTFMRNQLQPNSRLTLPLERIT